MRFFDLFRAKWRHPDPSVRAAAVADIRDQATLERLAASDPVEAVRSAAINAVTDQAVLARIAAGSSAVAVAAARRLEDRKLLAKIAQSAASGAVRAIAVERVDDGVMLHRISTSDTDARVRLKARSRLNGPDPVREFIRAELAKLDPTSEFDATTASFRGSLDDVAVNLIGDPRFRINGWLDHEVPGLAHVRNLDGAGAAPTETDESRPVPRAARFLAFKRGDSGDPAETATANAYFEIVVWRTTAAEFLGCVEEKCLTLVADTAAWVRVSNSTRQDKRVSSPAAANIQGA